MFCRSSVEEFLLESSESLSSHSEDEFLDPAAKEVMSDIFEPCADMTSGEKQRGSNASPVLTNAPVKLTATSDKSRYEDTSDRESLHEFYCCCTPFVLKKLQSFSIRVREALKKIRNNEVILAATLQKL